MNNMNFLENTARQLYQRHKNNMHLLAVVFPNRRQSVFFRDYLKQLVAPPAFVPELLTIEELVQLSSDQFVAEPLVQSIELYKAYVTVCNKNNEENIPGFEQFYPIGETLLKDFREMDTYLVDIAQACRVLKDIEIIEKSFEQLTDEQRTFLKKFWSSLQNRSLAQERFLKLWERLPAIYQQFHQQLHSQNSSSLGWLYRQLAAGNPSLSSFTSGWDHIAFVGFNAFNKAEETIIYKWQQNGFASLWFDADKYYLENKQQEAGFFLRKNFEQTGLTNELPLLNVIGNSKMAVTVTSVMGHTAQTKLIGQWLEGLPPNSSDSIAIILADENLLIPVLQSIPANSAPVNVTMGYPLQQTVLFSFIKLYFDILTSLGGTGFRFLYFQQVQDWLNHPLCDWEPGENEALLLKMTTENLLQVPVKMLQKKSAISSLMMSPLLSNADIFSRLRQMLQLIDEKAVIKKDALLHGAASLAWQSIQTLEPLFAGFSPAPTLAFMSQVLQRHLSSVNIAFQGEPLKGIQVMGLLESRGLDFDHILLLGAAEGSLPRINPPQSFLPDSVRRAFGMPVAEYQDAIFAYTFYRLLHRCKSLQLVYNGLVSDNSTGEPSRFIKQLAFETGINFRYRKPGTRLQPTAPQVISIPKTDEILRRLKKYLLSEKPASFSPSQINTYLSCRLQFFLKYIAGLKKPEDLSEEINAAQFGQLVHKLMERLYLAVQAAQGHGIITADSIHWMRQQAPAELLLAFSEVLGQPLKEAETAFSGLQQLIKDVALQYANGFLDLDEAYAPFTVIDLEVQFLEPFVINESGHNKPVFLKGYIDRVDEKNGIYRMLDYKTGADKMDFADLASLFERNGKKQNKAALQTLIYSWMFRQKFPERKNFEPALVPLRELVKAGKSETRLEIKTARLFVNAENIGEMLAEIENQLRATLEEIFDPTVAFDQTEDTGICAYCDFAGICNRK